MFGHLSSERAEGVKSRLYETGLIYRNVSEYTNRSVHTRIDGALIKFAQGSQWDQPEGTTSQEVVERIGYKWDVIKAAGQHFDYVLRTFHKYADAVDMDKRQIRN